MRYTKKMTGVLGLAAAVLIVGTVATAVVIMSNAVTWTNNVSPAPNLYVQMVQTPGWESNYLGDPYQYSNAHYYASFNLYTDSGNPLSGPSITFTASENGWYPNDMYVMYNINGGGWNTMPMGSGYGTQSCTIDLNGYNICSWSTVTINVDAVYYASGSFSWSATLNGSI